MIILHAVKRSIQQKVLRPNLSLVLPARETLSARRARLSDSMVKESTPGSEDYARRLAELIALTVRIQKGE